MLLLFGPMIHFDRFGFHVLFFFFLLILEHFAFCRRLHFCIVCAVWCATSACVYHRAAGCMHNATFAWVIGLEMTWRTTARPKNDRT